jgi:hypothetical protein
VSGVVELTSAQGEELKSLFEAERWMTRKQQIVEFVSQWKGPLITYPEIYNALGMQCSHFCVVMQSLPMKNELDRLGWTVKRSRPNVLVRVRG